MNLFINLKENKDLSKNERILANYILKHPEDVLKMSSKDLGKVCFVSTATVYRLCDKLGLLGFSDLKIKILLMTIEKVTKILILIFLLINFKHIMKSFKKSKKIMNKLLI